MKRTSSCVFSLSSNVFAWCLKKQQLVAQSSAEVETFTASLAVKQAIWLKKIIKNVRGKKEETTILFGDNKLVIAMAKNPIFHSITKRIALKYHFIHEAIEKGEAKLSYANQRSK
jgi:hypothetical protein